MNDYLSQALSRAENNLHPMRDLNVEDVKKILTALPSSYEPDRWANGWMETAAHYLKKADNALQQNNVQDAIEALQMGLRYDYIARWPIPNSKNKLAAYERLKGTFKTLIDLMPQKAEVVSIPYQAKFIKACLRLPDNHERPPVIIHWGGIDTWKEDILHLSNAYLAKGWASLMVDMPGTGESDELASSSGDGYFAAIIDHLETRNDIDFNKIVVQGSSWGGYWATKLAYTEKARIKGAVNWGGPVSHFFESSWQEKALSSAEYLFDVKPSVQALYGLDDFEAYQIINQTMCLERQGILNNPSSKMLYINGEKDSLVPFSEVALLKKNKNVDVWVNPEGIHMGVNKEITHRYIVGNIILPWLTAIFEE